MSANTSASVSADSHNLRSRRHSPRLSDSTNAKSPLQAVFGVEPNRYLSSLHFTFRQLTHSSGTSTPISEHAPPSVFATKTARNLVRSQAKRRLFPTVDYESRVSHFDKDSEHHDFRGFFVLFWIALAIMVITTMLRNFSEFGYPLHFRQYETFTANIWELALADLLMVASTALTIPLHLLFKNSTGILRWEVGGVWIQSLFQLIWFAGWCSFPFYRHWTWTAQDFFTLHLIAILMKLHSYAFYNGHLARTLQRLNNLDKVRADVKLKSEATIKYAEDSDSDHSTTRVNDLLVSQLTQTKQSNTVMPVSELRDDLARELVSPFGNITYPQNITLANYLDFICCPTLCYELEYPRRAAISYMELFYKVLALFGCIFLLTVISEEYIMPVLDTAQTRLAYRQDWSDGCLIFAETASSLLFPFLGAFLLVFFSIFEYLCGAFAELTRKPSCNFSIFSKANIPTQSLQTASSTPTGGTLPTGSSSIVPGTFPSTTGSTATSTSPRERQCQNPSLHSSSFSSRLRHTNSSWAAARASFEAMDSLQCSRNYLLCLCSGRRG